MRFNAAIPSDAKVMSAPDPELGCPVGWMEHVNDDGSVVCWQPGQGSTPMVTMDPLDITGQVPASESSVLPTLLTYAVVGTAIWWAFFKEHKISAGHTATAGFRGLKCKNVKKGRASFRVCM